MPTLTYALAHAYEITLHKESGTNIHTPNTHTERERERERERARTRAREREGGHMYMASKNCWRVILNMGIPAEY